MNNANLILIILLLYSCSNKNCEFNNSVFQNETEEKPEIILKSSKKSCSKFILNGAFFYNEKNINLSHNISLKDSTYYYENESDILFDFSIIKKSGELKLNDSIKLPINFFLEIPSNEGNYRLFKINNIGKYYDQNLSFIFVTHYRYGIVGSFFLGKELENYYVIKYKGYVPNKKYFYSIFKNAELL